MPCIFSSSLLSLPYGKLKGLVFHFVYVIGTEQLIDVCIPVLLYTVHVAAEIEHSYFLCSLNGRPTTVKVSVYHEDKINGLKYSISILSSILCINDRFI